MNRKDGVSLSLVSMFCVTVMLLAALVVVMEIVSSEVRMELDCEVGDWIESEESQLVLGEEMSVLPVQSSCKISVSAPVFAWGMLG